MSVILNEKLLAQQFKEYLNDSKPDTLKNDIKLEGYVIKNVPVCPDYYGEPSDEVAGDTLSRMYELINKNRDKKVIEYSI